MILRFNKKESQIDYKIKKKPKSKEEEEIRSSMVVTMPGQEPIDSLGQNIYINFMNKKIYERKYLIKNYLLVKDSLIMPKWKFLDSTTTIDKYKCNLAKTNYYSREYYAWYCIDLPFDKGPWKLNGLPGLILYAHDSENKVFWEAKKISYLKNKEIIYPFKNSKEYIPMEELHNSLAEEEKEIKARLEWFLDELIEEMKGSDYDKEKGRTYYSKPPYELIERRVTEKE